MISRLLIFVTLSSAVACFLLVATSLIHDIRIEGPPLWLSVFGSVGVGTGNSLSDPEWDPGRNATGYTWLDGNAGFVTWYEPEESKTGWYLKLPGWLLIPATAALPMVRATIWLVLFTRFVGRLRRGECGRCGYDLRESPERCPECGLEPVALTAV